MNLGRFHAAIYSIQLEIEHCKILNLLSELESNLQNSITQSDPESGDLFKQSYASLINILEGAESNYTFPTRRKIYKEIGATRYIGVGLAAKIKNTISENLVTPTNALVEIQKITTDVKKFYEKLNTLNAIFGELEIEYDELESGEFEIGFSFPKEIVGEDVESLEKEFHKLNFTLNTLHEISTGEVGTVKIKNISATEWQVFLESTPTLAACMVVAIERIVALYKNNLQIKLIKKQLDEKELPPEVTQPLQDYIKESVKIELRKIAEDIVEEFYKVDNNGRKNELKTQASKALQYIADRMDHGATIEVHAEPPDEPKPTAEGDDEVAPVDKAVLRKFQDLKEIVTKVNNSSKLTLGMEQSSGPVLSLDHEEIEEIEAEEKDAGL